MFKTIPNLIILLIGSALLADTLPGGSSVTGDFDVDGNLNVDGNTVVDGVLTTEGGSRVLNENDINTNIIFASGDYNTAANRFLHDHDLWHPYLSNILFSACKQYNVTAELDAQSHTLSNALFDGNFSWFVTYNAGTQLQITIDFSALYDTNNNGIGFGSGELIISSFGPSTGPESISARIWSYSENGWTDLVGYPDPTSNSTGDVYGDGSQWRLYVDGNHPATQLLEITINMRSSAAAKLTEIEFHPLKPTISHNLPFLGKFHDEILYHNLSFLDSSKAESIKLEPETGKIYAEEFVSSGTIYAKEFVSSDTTVSLGAGSSTYLWMNDSNSVYFGEGNSSATGHHNFVFGDSAGLALTNGSHNTALGYAAGYSLTEGSYNIALGWGSAASVSDGDGNVAIGFTTLNNLLTGNYNTAVGQGALSDITSGSSNVSIGSRSSWFLDSGGSNVALGVAAGWNLTSGNNNISIGQWSSLPNATGSDQLSIGNTIYGDLSNKQIGINKDTPEATLHVGGDGKVDGDFEVDGVITMNQPAGDISMGVFGIQP